MSVQVRPATIEDLSAICKLLEMLFEQEQEFQPDYARQQRAVSEIISTPQTGAILVMSRQEQVVGCVALLWVPSTALGGRVALLEDLIIDPSHRNQGLGKKLLQAAIDFAHSEQCQRITLLTDGDNEKAQQLYKQAGFTASSMLPMRKLL